MLDYSLNIDLKRKWFEKDELGVHYARLDCENSVYGGEV
ncbi:hypothetical protein Shell_0846 [Staphylothermus hellenicus DSM 12710]|uniref:Uncharacterized protein n=1 Tax=Staphylothermus hellenicus (strain DSM 12710 / JCM 10830 / BK20S6-10-b1 / P8) TaxID=591019 RepID=D7D862_STAHD|nr:hypothetical protein Shell_0846 [Staphylothermus hellenicus DSM 12710]